MSNKGFTLIEILISILILSIIGAMIVTTLISVDNIYLREATLLELQQQERIAMSYMTRELRGANNVTINEIDGSLLFNLPNATDVKYYFDPDKKQVIREYPSGTLKVLGNDISLLSFSLDGSLLEIQLSASKNIRGGMLIFPLSGNLIEKVKLRNG